MSKHEETTRYSLPRHAARAACCMAFAALALALSAAPAAAENSICEPGSGPGQCLDPQGVAVDFETGRTYVADQGNDRVDVFAEDGSFVASWEAGFTDLGGIAVDNAAASPSRHDVYVVDGRQVKKLSPAGALLDSFGEAGSGPGQFESIRGIGVSGAGVVYVLDTKNEGSCEVPDVGGSEFRKRVQKFDEDGNLVEAVEPTDAPCGQISGFAVNSGGEFYLSNEGPTRAIRKYSPAAAALCTIEPGSEAMAVDEADRLYAVQGVSRAKSGLFLVVTKYGSGCSEVPLRRFGYGEILANRARGLAARQGPPSEALVGEEGGAVKQVVEPSAGPIIAPPSVKASGVGNSSATLEAEINPEGKASEYRFEYVDEESFEATGYATAKEIALSPLDAGAADFNLHLASALAGCADPLSEEGHPGETAAEAGECLAPETTYRFRVFAINADGEGNAPVEGTPFETEPAGEILATFATEVGSDSARLNVEVNPLGLPTSGYFEYVDGAAYEKDVEEGGDGFAAATKVPDPEAEPPQGELDFGSGTGPLTRGVSLALKPGTAYRFRAAITGPLLSEPIRGEERSLVTFSAPQGEACPANEAFRTGPSALLPDCRAYELVTPLDKEGAHAIALNEPAGGLPAVLNQSSLEGDKLAYGTYRAFGDAPSAPYTSQYLATRDPGTGWSSHSLQGERTTINIQVASTLNTELKMLSPDLCQAWVRTLAEPVLAPGAVEGFTNLYSREDQSCGAQSWQALTTVEPAHNGGSLELQGASADGEASIYAMRDNLPGTGAPDLGEAGLQLYYQGSEGGPRYVCILPSGVASPAPCAAGIAAGEDGQGRMNNVDNAISADGQRVFWTDDGKGAGHIYMRVNPGQPQSAVSGGKCTQPARACTIAVSAKGEELSGTSKSRWWGAADDGSVAVFTAEQNFPQDISDLYAFDTETETTTLIAGEVVGLMGMSEDASRIYLASEEVLSGANPQGKAPEAGEPNLYLYEGGSFDFIATLVATDLHSVFSPIGAEPRDRTGRVGPDGLHAAFMSAGSPTDYENTDALNREADAEVYLYDASGGGELICASCNPSGARPVGRNIEYKGNEFWAAAWIPVWSNLLYAPRVLSADGTRLFFNSSDALSPLDSNGVADVYQWEAPGSGGCDQADPDYFEANEGCVRLISSGQSAHKSEFVDADPSGTDVFIATLASLLPEDYGLVDVYDARGGGGFPPPPAAPVECEGEACQSPPPPPAEPSRASLSYRGPGDLKEAGGKPRCRKGKVRRRGRCVKRQAAQRKAKRKQAARRGRAERRAGR